MEGEALYDDYVEAVSWAQDYARANREAMMARVLHEMRHSTAEVPVGEEAVNCHHNYVQRESTSAKRAGHPQGRGERARGRARHHPGQHGREELHRARPRQRRTASAVAATAPAA
jgi:RNA-splicing ligase RtcB